MFVREVTCQYAATTVAIFIDFAKCDSDVIVIGWRETADQEQGTTITTAVALAVCVFRFFQESFRLRRFNLNEQVIMIEGCS